jgi:hypothetical protein
MYRAKSELVQSYYEPKAKRNHMIRSVFNNAVYYWKIFVVFKFPAKPLKRFD